MNGTKRLQQGLLLAAGALALAVVAVGLSDPIAEEEGRHFWDARPQEPPRPQSIAFRASAFVQRPASEVEHLWRSATALPQVLRFLNSAQELDERRMRWTLRSTLGVSVTVDLALIEEERGSHLLWDVSGDGVAGRVRVDFTERGSKAPKTTDLTVALDLRTVDREDQTVVPLQTFFGDHPDQRLADDLRRLAVGLERGILKIA